MSDDLTRYDRQNLMEFDDSMEEFQDPFKSSERLQRSPHEANSLLNICGSKSASPLDLSDGKERVGPPQINDVAQMNHTKLNPEQVTAEQILDPDNTAENNKDDSDENELYMTPAGFLRNKRPKRKAEFSPIDPRNYEFLLVFEKIYNNATDLRKMVLEATNTKTEIKKKVDEYFDLTRVANSLKNSENSRTIENNLNRNEVAPKLEAYCTSCKNKICEDEVEKKAQEQKENIRNKIEMISSNLIETSRLESIHDLLGEKWPASAYTKVTQKKGNPFIGEWQHDMILLVKKDENSKLVDSALHKFPDMKELLIDETAEKKVQLLENIVRINNQETIKKLYIVKMNNTEDLMEAVKELRKYNIVGDVGIVSTERKDWERTRKLMEIEFYNEAINIFQYVPGTVADEVASISNETSKTEHKTIHVRVKNGKESYNNVLKKMLKEINTEEVGVDVKQILKTNDGNAKIILEEKKKGSLKTMETKMNECLGEMGNAVTVGAGRKTIFIRNIDSSAVEEDVVEAIENVLCQKDKDIKIRLKSNYRGTNQTATAEMDLKDAMIILKAGHLKIGWLYCNVEEYINPPRCFNCLQFGHKSFQCARTTEEKGLCFRCNERGHTASSCVNEAFCRDCHTIGHQAGNMRCRNFKELVMQTRSEHRIRRNRMTNEYVSHDARA